MRNIESAYGLYIKERFPLPSEKNIADLEKQTRIEFPGDFRNYILNYNGGYFIEPDIAPPTHDCPVDRLIFMYGINASHPSAELASAASLAVFSDNDPPEILPIGYTIMGNLILLIVLPDNKGLIVLKKAFSDEFTFLADGIEDFFGLLQKHEDNEM
jgi:hypothetical protein